MTCYDVRFPEVARSLAVRGADVIIVSAAWVRGRLKERHWKLMTAARALENTCYVLACSEVSARNIGCSRVIDPLGEVIAQAGDGQGGAGGQAGMLIARLHREVLESARRTLPVLENRASQTRNCGIDTNSPYDAHAARESATRVARHARIALHECQSAPLYFSDPLTIVLSNPGVSRLSEAQIARISRSASVMRTRRKRACRTTTIPSMKTTNAPRPTSAIRTGRLLWASAACTTRRACTIPPHRNGRSGSTVSEPPGSFTGTRPAAAMRSDGCAWGTCTRTTAAW